MKNAHWECNTKERFAAWIFALAIIACGAQAWAAPVIVKNRWERQAHPSVMYYNYMASVDGQPVRIHIAEIDLSGPVRLQPVLAWDQMDRLETVTSIAKRHKPIVAINGSYFNMDPGDAFPVGFLMLDGRVVYFSHTHRSAFGLTRDNVPLFGYPRTRGSIYVEDTGEYFYIDGMNRERSANQAIVYTMEYGKRTVTKRSQLEIVVERGVVREFGTGNMRIPTDGFVISLAGDAMKYKRMFRLGAPVKLYFVIEAEWLRVFNALTGGPMLMRGGRIVVQETQSEQFKRSMHARNPLTAVASKPNGRLLFVVVDGRRPGHSVGLSYVELSDFLRSIGANNAIAMDGGGSSTMVINGELVNKPSDGSPRGVTNALCVFQRK